VAEAKILPTLAIPPLPLFSRDFWGNPISGRDRFPGPFQNWPDKGSVHWHLWPVQLEEN